ncbi:hypothetical protein JVU11DRAFT_6076 [Chiua virens]|nr:hypothetical protein JVU11DRAFT_6076 [Chiua virens]
MPSPGYLLQLPFQTASSAPCFDATIPSQLPAFLKHVDQLATSIGLMDAQKINTAIWYAYPEDTELWRTSQQVLAAQPDWSTFVADVQHWYSSYDDDYPLYVPEPSIDITTNPILASASTSSNLADHMPQSDSIQVYSRIVECDPEQSGNVSIEPVCADLPLTAVEFVVPHAETQEQDEPDCPNTSHPLCSPSSGTISLPPDVLMHTSIRMPSGPSP